MMDALRKFELVSKMNYDREKDDLLFYFLRKRIGSVTWLNMYTSGIHIDQHME